MPPTLASPAKQLSLVAAPAAPLFVPLARWDTISTGPIYALIATTTTKCSLASLALPSILVFNAPLAST